MQYTETGHAKNAANFGSLILAAQSLGTSFNPSAVEIKIAALQTVKTNLDNAISAVRTSEAPYKNAVNARQLAFEGMSKLTTKMVNALEACGVTDKEVKDGHSMAKKVTGGRVKSKNALDAFTANTHKSKNALDSFIESTHETTKSATDTITPITDATVEEVVKHSVSQLSFDNRVENFKRMVTFLAGITKYSPNEADLKIAALNTYVNSLPALNNTVNSTHNTLTTARIARDKVLYVKNTGAYDLSVQVKHYVKSVFGATSPEYKMFTKIKLTDYSNK